MNCQQHGSRFPKTLVDSLAILTNGPAISGFGQKPNGQTSSAGGFRQYTDRYALESSPVRFKKPTMLSVTEQPRFLKSSVLHHSSDEKQPISGGYVVASGTSSLDAMVGGRS